MYIELYVLRMGGTFIMEKCPFCLAETRAGDNFCLNCGNRLGPGTAASASPQGQPAVGDATLAAPDDWAASMPASGPIWSDGGATIAGPDQSSAYDPHAPTLRGDLIEQPARFIVHSDGGEKVDEYQLKKLEVSIGRATTSDIPLLRDKLTSRRHATVRYENGHYVLRDERSANGTFVNGQQLAELTPHILQDGDRIGIGEHELVFRAYGSPSTNVEDLPTIAVPFNPPDLPTFKVPDGTAATMIAAGDYSTRDNGTSGEAALAPPPQSAPPSAAPGIQPPAPLVAVNQAAGSAAPANHSASPVTSEPPPSIPVATSYNFPAPPAASPPATKISPSTPSASTGVNKDMTSTTPKTDANVTFNRLTSIAQPPLPDMTTLIAAVSTLDSQVAALQEQLHVTQEAMRSHDTEVAQVASELRKGVRRVADRMDGTIADVARSREALAWAELSQLLEDVKNNPRDIEYVTRLARKAHELDKIIRIYQNVVQTMAECNSLLRSMIGEDR
jgi:hypothetical protein